MSNITAWCYTPNMHFPVHQLTRESREYPRELAEIPDPPETLYVRGSLAPHLTRLTVVGSRDYTSYGKQVTTHLINGLRGAPLSIVSGLALGIDSIAHHAALDAGLHTLVVPGSGIDDSVLYPARHRALAREILERGGGLLSEFPPTFSATRWSFPKRNRIMAGIARGVLLVEATERSGTLITARLASDYDREICVVPGSIFSRASAGTHQFLRLGATPVTESSDILAALGVDVPTHAGPITPESLPHEQAAILTALTEPTERDTLAHKTKLSATELNVVLMEMELAGLIAIEHTVVYRRV